MALPIQRPLQFSLASLFLLNLAVAVLLASWRIGWWKVAATVSFISGVTFAVVWATLLLDELRR